MSSAIPSAKRHARPFWLGNAETSVKKKSEVIQEKRSVPTPPHLSFATIHRIGKKGKVSRNCILIIKIIPKVYTHLALPCPRCRDISGELLTTVRTRWRSVLPQGLIQIRGRRPVFVTDLKGVPLLKYIKKRPSDRRKKKKRQLRTMIWSNII